MGSTKGLGLPSELEHHIIAQTYGISPHVVLEWDEEMVEEWRRIQSARDRYAKSHPGG